MEQEQKPTEQSESILDAHQPNTTDEGNDKSINFASLRKKLDERERLLQEKEQQNLLLQQQLEQEQKVKKSIADPRFLKDDDYIYPSHYNSLLQEVDLVKRELDQTKNATARAELRAQYTDFEKIMTRENLAKIAETHPEFVATIDKSTENAYNRMASLYHAIKLSTVPKDYQKKSHEVEQDINRVKSVSSIRGSNNLSQDPLIRGRRLSPEIRNRFSQEIEEYMPVI